MGIRHAQTAIERNPSLDGLRGIAVLLTFLVHYCGNYLASFRGANPNVTRLAEWQDSFDKILYWLFRSHHGVYIFFILSGYLIARISFGPHFSYFPFVRNRFARIYPAFLLALVACIAIDFVVLQRLPSGRTLILNLLFLNGFPPAQVNGIIFNNVTWSLFYEMTFYIAFPLVLIPARYSRVPALLTIAFTGLLFSYSPALFGFQSELFLLLFTGALAGALPPDAIRAAARGVPDLFVVAAYGLVTTLMTTGHLTNSEFVWLFAGVGFLLLAKAVSGEGLLARGLAWGPLSWLGRISYSFYLLHSIAVLAVLKLWSHLSVPSLAPEINVLYVGLLGFSGAVLLGWAPYMIAERLYFEQRKSARDNVYLLEAVTHAVPRRPPDAEQERCDDRTT